MRKKDKGTATQNTVGTIRVRTALRAGTVSLKNKYQKQEAKQGKKKKGFLR